jgi:signal transduction histidine kinase
MMPGMDGFEVCRRLKANPALRDIPVIFISALSDTMDKIQAFEAGGVDYVMKPFEAAEVEARVRTHIELRRQRRQIETQKREIQANYDKLRELEQLRDNLVHMIVHDMRSPLMGVCGMLEVLQGEIGRAGDAQHLEYIEEALTSGRMLTEMVSSLLDVSRLEGGQMPLAPKRVDLREVVDEALTSLVALVKQCTLVYDRPACEVRATCDPHVIRRVIANIVANAIRFTPGRGQVRIELASWAAGAKVCVTDAGPGIPLSYQEKIFDKFVQVQARAEGNRYSAGLGLAFCKLAVEAHGGRIGVKSDEGRGSTFWFSLPG